MNKFPWQMEKNRLNNGINLAQINHDAVFRVISCKIGLFNDENW